MQDNIIFRLRQIEKEYEKLQRQYVWAVYWGDSTKGITYKMRILLDEAKQLQGLLKNIA